MKIEKILNRIKIPYAYLCFPEGKAVPPPFVCWFSNGTENIFADGKVWIKINVYSIELYTDKKDIMLEERIEKILSACKVPFEKQEVWIESERLYEVQYEFLMED